MGTIKKEDLKYKTLDQFLADDELRVSDVMVSRGKKSFVSKAIMKATNSHWSHAGLVFVVPKPGTGYNNAFIIESVGDGVDITNLRHYAEEFPDKFDVGIKRLEKDWFTNESVIAKTVRGNMLNFIKAEYDMGTILSIGRMILAKIIFGLKIRFGADWEKTIKKTLEKSEKKKGSKSVPNQFICSGFVQYGFYKTVEEMKEKNALPQGASLDDVIFNKSLSGTTGNKEKIMLHTTPEDIAGTDKLQWKYIIKGGWVYKVTSKEEVECVLS